MLIDDVKIRVKAGDGGKGAVTFNKNMMMLGPTGGSGADGGSVFFEGVSDLGALRQFRHKKEFLAMDGENGKGQFRDGHTGEDLFLKVPVGTVIHNITTGKDLEIVKVGEKVLVAKGGHGGKGNFLFRSPRDTSPKRFQEGLPGESWEIRLELKLIADVGFVGFPNAGKSSLLNELTKASAKVANYPFTTLEPNLGVYFELILADIPGIIEGASTGKGLGIKFLRHIDRTKIIFHFVSAESATPAKDWKTIRKELGKYSSPHQCNGRDISKKQNKYWCGDILKKKEYLFLSKSDMLPEKELKKKLIALKKLNKNVIPISIYDFDSIEKVKKILNGIKDKK